MKIIAFGCRSDERDAFEKYANEFNLSITYESRLLNFDTVDLTKGYDGVSVIGLCNVCQGVLEKLKENGIQWVASRSMGYNNIDVTAAKNLSIKISSAIYSPYCVSDYTLMLMLMTVRKVSHIIARTHSMDYSLSAVQGKEMHNLTIGVIGTGKIGYAVIKALSGFGCKILAYDPKPSDAATAYATYVELDTLYRQSDLITLHTPLFASNRYMINKNTLDIMKDGVILINTARGELINTADLINALESGKVGGAGIDCFENEMGIVHKDHNYAIIKNRELAILKSYPNVTVTPHVAFFTDQAVEDMVLCSLKSLHLFYNNLENPYEIKG
ncbi:MAG: D-isomer specific 2-hydroxyacid dehydrogenase family protein [Cellulosilyticaceae bacterium]